MKKVLTISSIIALTVLFFICAAPLMVQDQIKLQLKDGSCKTVACDQTQAQDQDQDQDQTKQQLKDGSCKVVACDQTQAQDQIKLQLKDGSC